MSTRAIHKYVLRAGITKVNIPSPYEVLHVHAQDDDICFWVEFEPETANSKIHTFAVYPTGAYDVAENDSYIGTAHLFGGKLVFHVYERVE